MGVIESQIKKQIRLSRINKAVITSLAVAGGIGIAVVAPNLANVLGKTLSAQLKQTTQRSLTRLVKHGYIRLDGGTARLTQKGEKCAALMGEGKLVPKKPKRWDRKWRILIFDISNRSKRDQVRKTLRTLGLCRLQNSVWVYPYDCEDLITLLKADFRIGKDLLYIVADAVEHDKALRYHFGLE